MWSFCKSLLVFGLLGPHAASSSFAPALAEELSLVSHTSEGVKLRTAAWSARRLLQDSNGEILIGYVRVGDISAVKRLLSEGADPNFKSSMDGTTPLVMAIWKDFDELVKLLIGKGASADEVYSRSGVKYGALQYAALIGSANAVRALLDTGSSADALNENGIAALHIAAGNGFVLVASTLLDYGAWVDLPTSNLTTPLYYAARYAQLSMVKLLLARGAEVDKRNNRSMTPLMGATYANSGIIIQELALSGANINAAKSGGHTSLHIAAFYGHQVAMEVLLLNGADKYISLNGSFPIEFLCSCASSLTIPDICKVEACRDPRVMVILLK